MSVEKTESRTGVTYKVRWRHAGVHHARRFTTLKAAERFERKVRTSRRQANSICSTSLFRSGMTYLPSTMRPGHTVRKLHIAIDPLTPGERRDLADALLLAEWGAALEEPRVLLLDLALATDEQLPWAFA